MLCVSKAQSLSPLDHVILLCAGHIGSAHRAVTILKYPGVCLASSRISQSARGCMYVIAIFLVICAAAITHAE